MKRIATLFFVTAVICALVGMAWGIQMSATQDHTLSPAHAHLNLIGFVVMAVFGTYYALTPSAAASRLAMAHYVLSVAAVVIMVPGIVMAITGTGEAAAKIGSLLAILAMAFFGFVILRHGVGENETSPLEAAAQAAK